jgi:hypothetical protein
MHVEVPKLYVEGPDDVFVVGHLLYRHGVDTKGGKHHLYIDDRKGANAVIESIPAGILNTLNEPVGFIIDIDTECQHAWDAVKTKLSKIPGVQINPPPSCPPGGFTGQITEVHKKFGVWLMPDCCKSGGKLEHLIETLIPEGNPVWGYAKECTTNAARLIDEANQSIKEPAEQWCKFRPVDEIKAQVHTWIAWQECPGTTMGMAIGKSILKHDSPEAIALLKWLRDIYGFPELQKL